MNQHSQFNPTMQGKVVLVTGSTDGIGRQTALTLAQLGATVLIHGRSPDRAEMALQSLQQESGSSSLTCFYSDFGSLHQVRRMAGDILSAYPHLDVLINNAGMFTTEFLHSEDGYELTFAVNHLAPFLLTNLLLKRIKASAPSRIITVTSSLHLRARLDLGNLQGEKGFNGLNAYNTSKLCNVLFSVELAERLSGSAVTANCLHPGVLATKIVHRAFAAKAGSVTEGAKTPVYLACSPEVENISGAYFENCKPATASILAQDSVLRGQLWDLSEKLVGDFLS